MIFARSKKLTFFNNKGGVGKTTLAYNVAVEFANKGYKTVMIDLDPQCNLTRLALGDENYEDTLFSSTTKTIYDVLAGVLTGGGDVLYDTELEPAKGAKDNLYLLRGDIRLSEYEFLLSTGYNQAAAGIEIGYFQTSAIDRFLNSKGLNEQVDIFAIDTSPTLGLLNRVILLGSDYFAVPLNPDAFSLQGIENLGIMLEKWRTNWSQTAKVMAREQGISSKLLLEGMPIFIGYILNSYNVYAQKPIRDHRRWIEQIPEKVKGFLSERHSRNGLVAESSAESLQDIQDYGRLPSLAHETGQAIFDIDPKKAEAMQTGTRENIEKAKVEFDGLSDRILQILGRF